MQLTHDDILAALQAEYPSGSGGNNQGGVYLVARLKDSAIGMNDSTPHVFLPDCHLATRNGAKRFPRVTADEPQVAALERFLRFVRKLAGRDTRLRFWQLGDFVDLWRVGEDGQSVTTRMTAFSRDRDSLVGLLGDLCPGGVKSAVLAGNHDLDLRRYKWRLTLEQFISSGPGQPARAHLFHGHQVDPIEALPQAMKEFFARGATESVPPAARTMLEATNPHWLPQPLQAPLPSKPREAWKFFNADLVAGDPVPLTRDAVNVIEHTPDDNPSDRFMDVLASPGSKVSADPPSQTFFSDAAFWADRYDAKGHDLRLAVIGHTHRPRIVRGRRAGGKPFVLMDCGAWIGTGFLSMTLDRPIRKSQFGVKVGDDLRIYQVEYRAAV
jgi:UDP-2,3-diacylglucosamine pyrophosphatase LpxH